MMFRVMGAFNDLLYIRKLQRVFPNDCFYFPHLGLFSFCYLLRFLDLFFSKPFFPLTLWLWKKGTICWVGMWARHLCKYLFHKLESEVLIPPFEKLQKYTISLHLKMGIKQINALASRTAPTSTSYFVGRVTEKNWQRSAILQDFLWCQSGQDSVF